MSAATEITLATGRGRLAALRSGDPKGPKLLALHGWLDNAASFEPLLPELADVDLVALDLAGHGASEHRATGYDYVYADWVHDVIDVLDSLGWERADLLGHSMGATIASTVAAAAPERVRRLALIEGLGPLGGDAGAAGLRLREAIAARRAYEARAGEPPRRIPTMEAAVTARLMATPMRVEDAERIVDRNLQATEDGFAWRSDPRLRLPSTLRLNEEAVQSILRAIEAPTLLVAATPSPSYFTPAQRAARAACVRDLRVEVLEGGHHLHMEHPARVGALLRDFLAG